MVKNLLTAFFKKVTCAKLSMFKIKHLSGQYMSLRCNSFVNNFYKTAVKRQLSDNKYNVSKLSIYIYN